MNIVLSLYPNARGLGYACAEMPEKLLDSGVVTVRPVCNRTVMERVRKFIDYYKPTIIFVRDPEPSNGRVARLAADIEAHAASEGLPVYKYTRRQTREVFGTFNATTKHEISQKILTWFPELAVRAPRLRKAWMEEDYNMGVFDAIALAVTHEYLKE
jgi:Holliday junction resolvasome RuvABC endonuclease subunit